MAKIYVASSWRNTYQQEVVTRLRAEGHAVYDFRGPGDGWGADGAGAGGFGWSEIDPNWKNWTASEYLIGLMHERSEAGFKRDMDALKAADMCVMVMPCGPSASMEMGYAAGANKFTAVYLPEIREPDLMIKMADFLSTSLDLVVTAVNIAACTYRRSPEQSAMMQWFKANGGSSTALKAYDRALQEFIELFGDISDGNFTHAKEEVADVGLCLMLVAEYLECDLLEQIRIKQKINDQRKWKVDVHGCMSHVKGSDPRDT